MKFLKHNNKIMTRTVILYLLIGVSIVAVMGIWMFASYINTRTDYCERELLKQQSNMYVADSDLETVYKNLQKLAESEEVKYIMDIDADSGEKVYEVSKFMDSINDWKWPFTPLYDVFIYIRDDRYIYTSDGRYTPEEFYGSYFESEDMSREQFMNLMTGNERQYWNSSQRARMQNTEIEVMPFIYSYPEYGKQPEVVVMGLLESSRLKVRTDLENDKEMAYSGILDGNGALLMGNLSEEDIARIALVEESTFINLRTNSGKYTAFVTVSPYNKWKYAEMVSDKFIAEKLSGYRTAATVLFVCMMMFVLALAFVITKTSIKPLQKIFSNLQRVDYDGNGDKPGYVGIDRVVERIIENNKQLEEGLDRYRDGMRNNFLRELLEGSAGTEDDIKNRARELEINFDGCTFAVVLVWVKNIKKEINRGYVTDSAFLINLMEYAFAGQDSIKFLEYDKNTVAVIMQARENEHISHIGFSDFMEGILSNSCDDWKIAIGRNYGTRSDIFYSFIDANATLKFMNIADNATTMVYNEDIEQVSSYYYPPEIEQRLINMVLTNAGESINQIFEHIYKENVKKRLGVLSFKYFKQAVIGTMIRIIDENLKNSESWGDNFLRMLDEVDKNENLQDFCESIRDFALNLCEVYEMSKLQREDKLKNKFESYIDEHYSDYGLTRKAMAEHFNLSESYFSRKFSEIFGKTFSAYLEEKKTNEAMRMIKETNLTINEIAERMGYSSAQVMRRAFVRQLGEPPSKYREK